MAIKPMKTGSVVFIALLIVCTFIPTVSATEERGVVSSDASEAQLKLINELWGKDISLLEYMESVHPEHLVGVPDSIKNEMANQKMIWDDAPDSSQVTQNSIMGTLASVAVSAEGYKADSRTIHFSGTCTAGGIGSAPGYIYAEAFLTNRNTGEKVDSTSKSGAGIWTVTASKDKLYPANGQYYVHAKGYYILPRSAPEQTADSSSFSFP